MVRECLCTLPNGRPCTHPALRGTFFCRHHQNFLDQPAAALVSDASPEIQNREIQNPNIQNPETQNQEISDQPVLIRHWREIGFRIPRMSPAEMEDTFSEILAALADDAISHRCAGRFIQLIVRRTEALRTASDPDRLRA